LSQEAGGHLIGEAPEMVVDLDFQLGQTGRVVSESVKPLLLERLGLSAERMEKIIPKGGRGASLGLETHLHS
jgi:hypothetical protein